MACRAAMHVATKGRRAQRCALLPKLRAAKTEQERAVLQNAVTATCRQADALVYELHGVTPEEIELVEQS